MKYKSFSEAAIDRTIREFSPSEPGSFERYDALLEQAESDLRQAENIDHVELSSVCAERIRIAFETGLYKRVIKDCNDFVREFSPSSPSFSNVVSSLILSLKTEHKDSQAVEQIVAFSTLPEFCGSELISLLAMLPKDVGPISEKVALKEKLERAVVDLNDSFPSLQSIDVSRLPVGDAARKLAEEVTRANVEFARAILGE